MPKNTHGGQRKGAGPPREMREPVKTTITLEQTQLELLKKKHGRSWQRVVRALITAYLGGDEGDFQEQKG